MKMTKKLLAILLAVLIISSCIVSLAPAVSAAVGYISGETGRTTRDITLADGTKTGATWTTINLGGSGVYSHGYSKVVNTVEFDLNSNGHLSLEALNCGTYICSKTTMTSAAKTYEAAHPGSKVLAAVNGDLWLMSGFGNTKGGYFSATRAALIIDREIWATAEIGAEAGINGYKMAMGVTSNNQVIVGSPTISTAITNASRGFTVYADGINRLPANNSLIVFNNRAYSKNYAMDDAYEILIESSNPRFTFLSPVSGTVKAIYPKNSASRPAIGNNSIVLTARGTRYNDIANRFAVGDTVTFNLAVSDTYLGNDYLWRDCVDACGGHMAILKNGQNPYNTSGTQEYPATIVGIKNDGRAMFTTVNSSSKGKYVGIRVNESTAFCTDLGYSNCFFMDGGGSATLGVTLNGTYSLRNNVADGSERAVINGLALVWNPGNEPEQPQQPDDPGPVNPPSPGPDPTPVANVDTIPFVFDNAQFIQDHIAKNNNVTTSFSASEQDMKIVVNTAYDPYVRLNVSDYQFKTKDYPYVVVTYRIPYCINSLETGDFFITNSDSTDETRIWSSVLPKSLKQGIYNSFIYDFSGNQYMMSDTGYLKTFRFDPFQDGLKDAMMYVDSVIFCKTRADAELMAAERQYERNGAFPEGKQYRVTESNANHGCIPNGALDAPSFADPKNSIISMDVCLANDNAGFTYFFNGSTKKIHITKNSVIYENGGDFYNSGTVQSTVASGWGNTGTGYWRRVTFQIDNGNLSVFIDGAQIAYYNDGSFAAPLVSQGSFYGGYTGGGYVYVDNVKYYNSTQDNSILTKVGGSTAYEGVTSVVKYNMNGGIGSVRHQFKAHGYNLTLQFTTPIRAGYTFMGWSEDPSATTATYTKENNTYKANASTTLYAVWKSGEHTHTWDDGVVVTAATCTEDGVKKFTCSGCSDTYNSVIPATGHSWDKGEIYLPASCTADGTKIYTCPNCLGHYMESIPALGHDFSDGICTRCHMEAPISDTTATPGGYGYYHEEAYGDFEIIGEHGSAGFDISMDLCLSASDSVLRLTNVNRGSDHAGNVSVSKDKVTIIDREIPFEWGEAYDLNWHNVRFVYVPGATGNDDGTVSVYIDGELIGTGENVSKPNYYGSSAFTFLIDGSILIDNLSVDSKYTYENDFEVAFDREGTGERLPLDVVTVSFDADGQVPNQIVYKNVSTKLRADKPQKEGFMFGGWKFGDTLVQPGGRITTDTAVTLKAEWICAMHSYTPAVTEPTCTSGGYTTYTCSKCGYSYDTDETAPLGHNYVNGICTRCGESEDDPGVLLGDIDFDGKLTAKDMNILKGMVLGSVKFSEQMRKAGDMNFDGKISASDVNLHKALLLG